ncbi:MAG: hypothetical protein ACTS4U_01380 [Candidatus Hodgkinia cicadicola]
MCNWVLARKVDCSKLERERIALIEWECWEIVTNEVFTIESLS